MNMFLLMVMNMDADMNMDKESRAKNSDKIAGWVKNSLCFSKYKGPKEREADIARNLRKE
jgi:hypothetical protein